MPLEDLVIPLVGAVTAGGVVQGLGAWFIITRLKKVDRISRRLDRFIQFWRQKDPDFRAFWTENGGED